MRRHFAYPAGLAWLLAGLMPMCGAWAQAPATRPVEAAVTRPAEAGGATATQPAMDGQSARVQKVVGNVSHSVVRPDGTFGPWQPAKEGDLLAGGTRIQTRLRSHVVLMFGDDTVVMIDRATLASINQFRQSADAKQIRLGLGHGAVRAGVASPTLRSDMTIATPTATLSKRGTMDFGLEYESSTGQFRAYLAGEGLVEVLKQLTGQRRVLAPGQYVTQAMTRWIETAVFDNWVPVTDVFGLTEPETYFLAAQGGQMGRGVAQPGAGSAAGLLPGQKQGAIAGRIATAPLPATVTPPGRPVLGRPEGNFGARR